MPTKSRTERSHKHRVSRGYAIKWRLVTRLLGQGQDMGIKGTKGAKRTPNEAVLVVFRLPTRQIPGPDAAAEAG